MSASRFVHLDNCEVKRVTDAAFLIEWEGEEFWIPISQIADPKNYEEGDEDANISITAWIAEKKGISV